uniref:RING-type E3 ubiquitin transferase n=1 Tax=Chenopodium quinoa TaxID=63459 RepID=A0A803NCS4_CHEQI
MWLSKENSDKRNTSNQLVAVAIDRDKGSQHALKWAIDNLLQRGQTVVLVHVKVRPSYGSSPHIVIHGRQWDQQTKDLFLPFRCFCTRKDIQCRDIVLEDSDVQKALIEFVTQSAVEVLIMGASSRNSILRSTFTRGGRHPHVRSYGDILSDNDISFVSSGRASVDRTLPSTYDVFEERRSTSTNRLSSSSENDYMNETPQRRSFADTTPLSSPPPNFSNYSFHDNSNSNWSSNTQSQSMDDVEAQMRKLKMELAQTMNMYSSVCKEALTAKQKALDLQRWKVEEERRMDEAQDSEESTQTSFIEKNKAKSKASIEASEAHKRLLELEAQKRISAEMKALKEVDEKNKDVDRITTAIRYRKYTIEEIEVATEYFAEARKIGEGGYGPVFRCHLDHTVVAVKVLRPDAAQGRSQFQQEVYY